MLSAMRRLALDSLYFELGEGTDDSPEAWYRELRENDAAKLFPKLVEKSERIERVYVLSADPRDADTAVLEVRDFLPETDPLRLPFNQPSGSQSAALGPVIKRTGRHGRSRIRRSGASRPSRPREGHGVHTSRKRPVCSHARSFARRQV